MRLHSQRRVIGIRAIFAEIGSCRADGRGDVTTNAIVLNKNPREASVTPLRASERSSWSAIRSKIAERFYDSWRN
jgi:hypothetical protein